MFQSSYRHIKICPNFLGEFTTPLTTGSSHKHEQNLSSTSGVVADGMRPGKAKTENLDENPHALVPALHTGLNALDMLLRPKLGDRILLAGELLALQDVTTDVICNQARYWDPPEWSTEPFPPVRCIYVSLGETDISPLQARIAALEEHGGMGYTTFIACLAHEPPIHRYLAPFIASTIASHWRSLGEHCLVVVDDMNAHAEAFVELERDVLEGSQHRGIADELHSVFAQLMDRPSRPLGPDVGSVTWFCMSELDMSKIWVRRRDQDHSLELQKRRGATGNRTQVKYGLGLQRQVFRAVNSIADDSMFFDSTASARFPDQAMQALGIPDRRAKRKGPAPPSSTFATHYDNYPPFLPFIELIGSSKKPEDDEKAATFPRAFRHTMDSIKYEILNCREHIARLLEINQRKDLKKYMERIGVDAGRITKRRDHRKRDRYVNMQHLELLLTRDIPVISKSNVTATHSVHRGQILCRVLHQTPRNPLSVLEQVVVVHACTKGYLDTFPPIDLVIDCVLDGILDTLRANNQSSKDLVSRTQQWLDWTPDERDPAAGNDKVFLETILPEIMERASKPIRARISSLETDI